MLLVIACRTGVIYLLLFVYLFVSDFPFCSLAKEAIILERLILQQKWDLLTKWFEDKKLFASNYKLTSFSFPTRLLNKIIWRLFLP